MTVVLESASLVVVDVREETTGSVDERRRRREPLTREVVYRVVAPRPWWAPS